MADIFAAPAPSRIPIRIGGKPSASTFPVHRIYCIGRNYAEHAREMGASTPVGAARDESPMFFMKPADAITLDPVIPYPTATTELHHEVELVVALGRDAPDAGTSMIAEAADLVYGYAIGLDLTRRDLQAQVKARAHPWDVAKGFDRSAPISAIIPADELGDLHGLSIQLQVNGQLRQHGQLQDMIWNVAEILHALSRLFALRAGDLIFTGTPAGVGPLRPGDHYRASLGRILTLDGRIGPTLK